VDLSSLLLLTRLVDVGADGGPGWRECHGRALLAAAARGLKKGMVWALLKAAAKPDVNVKFGAKQRQRCMWQQYMRQKLYRGCS